MSLSEAFEEAYCDCGKPAFGRCGVGVEGLTLVLCERPTCKPDGGHCEAHRHRTGTMGYPHFMPARAVWHGIDPDGPGLWEFIKAKWKSLTYSPQRAADEALKDIMRQFVRPSPLPPFELQVGNQIFERVGERMVLKERVTLVDGSPYEQTTSLKRGTKNG